MQTDQERARLDLIEYRANLALAYARGGDSGGYTPNLDQNSLVLGALDRTAWQSDAPTIAPVATPVAGVSSVTGLRSLIGVNSEANCPLGGYLERPFTVPAGVTSIAIELDEVQLGYGDGATGAAAVQLYDFTGLTQLASRAFSPTAVPTKVTSGNLAVTPGTEYRVRIACNIAGQSRFLCARARVRPTASADPFWLSFQRLEVDASNLQANAERGQQNPRYTNQPGLCFVGMQTTAAELRVEVFENAEYYIGAGNYQAEVFVNGSPFATLTPPATQDVSYLTCVLPPPSETSLPMSVRVGAGIQVLGDGLGLSLNRGTLLKAIYTPAEAKLDVQQVPVRTAVLYGDSKTAGAYASIPAATSYAEILREHGWQVDAVGLGGAYLFRDVGGTLTVAACAAEALRLVAGQPDLVIIAMGRNDWLGGFYSPANLITQLGNLADAVHAADPSTTVAIMTWTHEQTENPVAGVTWDAERQAMAALVTTRSPWCVLIDSGGAWTSAMAPTYTADTVHPNDAGYSRDARIIESAGFAQAFDYVFKPSDLAPTAWWESDVNLAGGAMGAVTSGGTAPPVVTMSGSPANAAMVIAEIRVGGPLGTATFDASIDGGRSWPYRSVPTAAAVPLPAFGVTLHFAAGVYTDDNTYFADSAAGNWSDMLGSGLTLVPGGSGVLWTPPAIVGTPPQQGVTPASLLFTGATPHMAITGLDLPQPFTVVAVGVMAANVLLQPIIGQNGAASGPYVYADVADVAANFNGVQIAVPADITKLHCYTVMVDGGASVFYIDGVGTAGALGAGNFTGQWVGGDSVNALYLAGNIMAYGIIPTGVTPDQALCIASRMRFKYGTP